MNNNMAALQGVAFAFLAGMLCALVVGLGIGIYLLYLVYTCYARLPARYRRMEPGMVWLLLIPLFNLYWQFVVYLGLSQSYQAYFRARGRRDVGDCGYALAMTFTIGLVAMIPFGFIPNHYVQLLRGFMTLAFVVVYIIYIVTMVGLRNQIGTGESRRRRRDDDDDDHDDEDDDDRPRRRASSRGRRDDEDEEDEDEPPRSRKTGITSSPSPERKKKKYEDEDEDDEDEDDRPRRRR